MPTPNIQVILFTPSIPGGVDLAPLLSQDSNPNLSILIEDPTGTNNFTTGDITLKGYDAPNGTTVSGYFAGMLPTSKNFLVFINMSMIPPGGVAYSTDMQFQGYVDPNSLQFVPNRGEFSFTVIGNARKLQADASGLLKRPGYVDGKWTLNADVSKLDKANTSIQVKCTPAQLNPDFLAGDEIQIAGADKFTVVNVVPDPATSPPAFWTLFLKTATAKNYAGSENVNLLTPYLRNQVLHDVVSTLFTAAGFPVEQYFFSGALPTLAGLFASPMNADGLPVGGLCVGIAPAAETGGTKMAVSGTGGTFLAANATDGFTFLVNSVGYRQPPVDATNYGTAATMFGYKRTLSRIANPKYGTNITMKFYAYDHLAGNKRYILTVACNADVAPGTPFTISTKLESEVDAGGWVWGTTTLVATPLAATTTSTDLSEFYDAIGIDVDPATGTVFFTDIQLVGAAGTPVTMNTASYQPGGAGYVANRAGSVNGPVVFTAPGRVAIFMVDGLLGADPNVYVFTTVASGVMTFVTFHSINPYVIGRSLKKNVGDGRYYALVSDPNQGIQLASWATDSFVPDSAHPTTQIAPAPPAVTTVPPAGTQHPYEVDLAVQYGVSLGAGVPCPMFALIGGTPVYISSSGSGLLTYADMSGLSIADALQQLSVTIAGFFYLSLNDHWNFRSRANPMPANPIGVSDQIDGDAGFLNATVQPLFNRWVGYVSVQHESDATIFGDTSDIAGSTAFANADGQNLQLKSRFVPSISYAIALAHSLYGYLGAQKRWVEVNRIRDGRVYEIGRTFHCNADGANRLFQIIESDQSVCGVSVKAVGLEV